MSELNLLTKLMKKKKIVLTIFQVEYTYSGFKNIVYK